MSFMVLLGVLAAVGSEGTPAVSVLVLPTQRCSVSQDVCSTIVSAVAADPALRAYRRVVTMREIEGVLTQQQARQIAGCDSNTCAAEIAGALNADEIVLSDVTVVGDVYVLSLSRVRARDAQVVSRVMHKVRRGEEERFIDSVPALDAELFGLTAPAAAPPQEARRTSSRAPTITLVAAGAVGMAAALLGTLVALGCGRWRIFRRGSVVVGNQHARPVVIGGHRGGVIVAR